MLSKNARSSIPAYSIWMYALIAGLCFYVGWVKFIPSQQWQDIGWYLSLMLTIMMIIAAAIYLRRQQIFYQRAIPSRILRGGFYLVMVFLLFIITFAGIVPGLGAILHQVVAQPMQRDMQVTKQHHAGRKSCAYRLEAEGLTSALPAYVCLSQHEYMNFPQQATVVTLYGKKSAFGFTVAQCKMRT